MAFIFYAWVEWIWRVRGRCLFTLSICGSLWVVWCTNAALGRAAAGLEHCVPMDALQWPVRSMPRRLRHGLWSTDTRAIDFFLAKVEYASVKMLQPKLEFPGVCRPLSQRLHLPSLLLVSLTAVSCTVLPDLFTEWRHRSPHSHLAGAEGCDRTFTRLNGPAWRPQSTPGMHQPPTRLI